MADFDAGKLPVQDEFQVYGWYVTTSYRLLLLVRPGCPAVMRIGKTTMGLRGRMSDNERRS